jgi:predicted flap endonuclease-1-like 5' DNA nuclease
MSRPLGLEGVFAAAVVGIIAAGAMLVVGDFGWLTSVALGGLLATVVWVLVMILAGAPMPPPRGEGNIDHSGGTTGKSAGASSHHMTPPAASAATSQAHEPVVSAAASNISMAKPVLLSAARDGGPDDLKKIKGVGPKLEGTLHAMGVYHFDQVARWTPAEVAWVDENLEGFKGRVSRDDWVDQATHLASGKETEFSRRVEDGDVY